jgi:hypothetical protein
MYAGYLVFFPDLTCITFFGLISAKNSRSGGGQVDLRIRSAWLAGSRVKDPGQSKWQADQETSIQASLSYTSRHLNPFSSQSRQQAAEITPHSP